MSVRRRLVTIVKQFDKLGYPISFKYKNDSSFKSFMGGLVTLAVEIVLFVYFIILLKGVTNHEKY